MPPRSRGRGVSAPTPSWTKPRARGDKPLPLGDILDFLETLEPTAAFEKLFGCLPDTNFFAKDAEGHFVLMDEGFVSMLGCSRREDVLGKTDFDFFPKDLAEKYVKDDRHVLSTGDSVLHLIEPVPDDNLTFGWWVVNKVPLRDRLGNIVGVAGITSKLSSANVPSHYGEGLFGILHYIGEHYRRRINLAELAAKAGLSVRSLERNFLKTFNTTPLRYINRVRLQAVRHVLIHSNKSLATIADDCGFYDQSHMTAQFTRHFGLSPRKYRAIHRLGAL